MPGIWAALRDARNPCSVLTKSPLLLRDLELLREMAVGELNRAGIPCGILVAPLMPGINDAPEQLERILALAAENGATGVGGVALHLRGDVRGVFLDWLRSQRPDLVERYEQLYARGAYAPKAERARLARMVRDGPVLGWGARERLPRGEQPGVPAPAPPPRLTASVQASLF
jgi:DNA repair photolyase